MTVFDDAGLGSGSVVDPDGERKHWAKTACQVVIVQVPKEAHPAGFEGTNEHSPKLHC